MPQSFVTQGFVAPCAGAWIEILEAVEESLGIGVAPCAGAWIEINFDIAEDVLSKVAPCAGAWIEIWFQQSLQ